MLRPMKQVLHQPCRLLYRLLRLLIPKETTGNLELAPHCWQVAIPCCRGPPPGGRGPACRMRSTCRQHAVFYVARTILRVSCLRDLNPKCRACSLPTCCKPLSLPFFAVAAELLFVPMLGQGNHASDLLGTVRLVVNLMCMLVPSACHASFLSHGKFLGDHCIACVKVSTRPSALFAKAATLEVRRMRCTALLMMHMLSAGAAGALFVYNRDCQSRHDEMVKRAVSSAMMGP